MQFRAVRRREMMTLLGGATAWPLAARAQQPMPVIGFLSVGSLGPFAHEVAAFNRGLGEKGYIENHNIRTEYRWAEGHNERLPAFAADLVIRRVAVIATLATVAIAAAKAQTTTIPIVFLTGGDPVKDGFVASFNRPEGNITGATWFSPDPMAKRLELLHQIVPNAAIVAQIIDQNFEDSVRQVPQIEDAARRLGLQLIVLGNRTASDIHTAFTSLLQRGASALVVGPGALHFNQRDQIIALATEHAIPTIYPFREFAEDGGLISYGNRIQTAFQWAGVYVGRILKGEKPADLPVMQSTEFELIINLKTAKLLGLEIPPMLLAIGDGVIE
jgi:putative tryptophan/tyrosine transport system substrate-binding protein